MREGTRGSTLIRPDSVGSLGPSLDRSEELPAKGRSRTATWVMRGVVVLLFAALTAQLWRLQVVDGRDFTDRSAANWLRSAVIPPERGVIYDRNKQVLAIERADLRGLDHAR